MKSHTFRLLSFSGIDGAGKSTQIEALLQHLQEQGHRFQLYTFWDDVASFSEYREHLSLRVFKGEKGVGSPDRPIARRDKNVTSWYVVLLRLFLYIFDAWRLSAVVSSHVAKDDVEFVVETIHGRLRLGGIPLRQPHFTKLAQVRLGLLLPRRREHGEVPLLEIELDIDAVGDLLAALDGIAATRAIMAARDTDSSTANPPAATAPASSKRPNQRRVPGIIAAANALNMARNAPSSFDWSNEPIARPPRPLRP